MRDVLALLLRTEVILLCPPSSFLHSLFLFCLLSVPVVNNGVYRVQSHSLMASWILIRCPPRSTLFLSVPGSETKARQVQSISVQFAVSPVPAQPPLPKSRKGRKGRSSVVSWRLSVVGPWSLVLVRILLYPPDLPYIFQIYQPTYLPILTLDFGSSVVVRTYPFRRQLAADIASLRMLPSYSSSTQSKMMARHHHSSSPGISNGYSRGNTFEISPHR